MTRVFIWKNNSPQEWEEISFSAFSKARRNGCFTGRFFIETTENVDGHNERVITECSQARYKTHRQELGTINQDVVHTNSPQRHDKFLQRTIEIQQQMEALRQSKAQIASEDYNPGRLDMEAIEAALCEAVEMHDGLVSEDFIDLFVSQVTPLSDSRFAWCLDFSPQPTVAFLNLAGQRKYTTCSMDSKLHFGPFADEEGHTIPFPGSLRR